MPEETYRKRIEQLQNSLTKYPDRTYRTVHVTRSKAAKKCEFLFIESELAYPQIENPNENEKIWNNVIYKKAHKLLGNQH